jgi:hypothetical protein
MRTNRSGTMLAGAALGLGLLCAACGSDGESGAGGAGALGGNGTGAQAAAGGGTAGSGGGAGGSYAVSITLLGDGTGTVTCGEGPCPSSVPAGTPLVLLASVAPDSTFGGWGGECSGAATTCSLSVSSDVAVTATFTATSPPSAVHWVSPTGAAAWAACSDDSPLDGAAACSMDTANASVAAGDLVYLRAGSYAVGIAPAASGAAAGRIRFKGYSGEKATISGVASGITVAGLSYVTIDDVDVDGADSFADLRTADHVWIVNCTLVNSTDTGGWPMGVKMTDDAQYNWLGGNTIGQVGYMTDNDDIGGVINVGDWANPNDTTAYNLIENNLFYHGGHHILEIAAKYNVFRNNTFHNENWTACPRPETGNLCGNRDVGMYDDSLDGYWNLLEGNRFAFAGASIDDATGSTGASVRSPHTIARRNSFYLNDGPGLGLYTDGTGTYDARYGHVYQNVFFHNAISPLSLGDLRYTFGVVFDNVFGDDPPIPITDVALANNLFYSAIGGDIFFYYTDPAAQAVHGNYYALASGSDASGMIDPAMPADNVQSSADPLFVSASAAQTVGNIGAFDFHLQPGSPAIDAGVFLTTTVGAGSGTTMLVADAGFFIDGFGIVDGDRIQLEGQTDTARIVAVDYGANQLTLDASLSWTAGQGVSLPYAGAAPDIGAYEQGAP